MIVSVAAVHNVNVCCVLVWVLCLLWCRAVIVVVASPMRRMRRMPGPPALGRMPMWKYW